MDESKPDRMPARSIHLQGGCRAIDNKDQKLRLDPVASGRIAVLPLPRYDTAYDLLRTAGFSVLGADFYFEREQTDGRRLPEWRTHHPIGSSVWPCSEQADNWSFIAYSAFRQKNGLLWDVASRIRYQLRTCDWRVRQVSESYRQQLHATVRAGTFGVGRRFKDGFTWLGYLAIQSFLVDACVLRNYLAEYRALILSQAGTHSFRTKITGMASLRKRYLEKIDPTVPVDQTLIDATAPGGWLYELGSYRDLVVHYAPLSSAGKTLYAVCTSPPFDVDTTLASIKLPIPSNPGAISAGRTSGAYFDDPELTYARFKNALDDPAVAMDGLQYAHASLGQLAVLAATLSVISPVKPEIPALTEKDIFDLKILAPSSESDTESP